jgi:FKBP-type peptidyl-prolyl cis-trans isomerase FklB
MKVGSKWEVYLPPNLAYGRNWLRKVGPESTVIFELELDGIAPPSAQSDSPRVIPQ